MTEQLISLETARLAKEKGFIDLSLKESSFIYQDEELIEFRKSDAYQGNYFGKEFYAPTQSLLQKWLRENHGLQITVDPYWKERGKSLKYDASVSRVPDLEDDQLNDIFVYFDKYEDALEHGLIEALNFIPAV